VTSGSPSDGAMCLLEESGYSGEHAYVSLLHGDRTEFLVYALLLGFRLKQVDASTPRVLLVGKEAPDQTSPFVQGDDRKCLDAVWQVAEVDLVDQEAADKTRRKRHRYVFTKLRAFQVPYRKLIFFDLDIIIRSSPKELFQVTAPAGMYHGHWNRDQAAHGQEIPAEAFYNSDYGVYGCINAGLMRLDTLPTAEQRRRFTDEMLQEVGELKERDQSYLPEQYFLVKKLPVWRHIEVKWNCEVNPLHHMDTRGNGVVKAEEEMPKDWLQLGANEDELREKVAMFHFSGKWLEPWWFLDKPPREALAFARAQFKHQDPRGMIALSVAEWLSAVEEMETSDMFEEQAENLRYNIEYLRYKADQWWANDSVTCSRCGCKNEWYAQYKDYCEECEVERELENQRNEVKQVEMQEMNRTQSGRSSSCDSRRSTSTPKTRSPLVLPGAMSPCHPGADTCRLPGGPEGGKLRSKRKKRSKRQPSAKVKRGQQRLVSHSRSPQALSQ